MAASGVESEPSLSIDRDSLLETSLRLWKKEFEQGIRRAAKRGDLEVFFTVPYSNGWKEIVKLLIRIAKENRLGFLRVVCLSSSRRRDFKCFPFDFPHSIPDEVTYDEFKMHESDIVIKIGVTWGTL